MNVNADRIKLIVTITRRGEGSKMVDYYKRNKLHYDFICLGMGTATSEILDYLGLEETEKDVVLTMAPKSKIPSVLKGITNHFQLDKPGKGIVFTIPLSSVSARVPQILCKPENLVENEETVMENDKKFELILTILNRGNVDIVMDAAKSAGATGGTLLHARRVGFEDVENIFGFTIQPEKDILAILAESGNKNAIMKQITEVAGINTESRALVLALPVDEIMGL
ncbi:MULTISPECIES: P-II family nitrogen regulator [Congzhengia]|uniref:P-II family nitrogen regulator n=1 Tax=Congzhengia minquanensis TaxID=2763657 RepID=A0A926HUF0_9FIRM|nr:P-II family nitrogen regulator [Congzhengia minquanensis]MBC8540512.1 P-II family nitrogen regulator [Congzhengia minquanensis]